MQDGIRTEDIQDCGNGGNLVLYPTQWLYREGLEMAQETERELPAEEFLLQFFEYEHLPPHLQMVSRPFSELAHAIILGDSTYLSGVIIFGRPLPRNPERTAALHRLLEAKDCAVRAVIAK